MDYDLVVIGTGDGFEFPKVACPQGRLSNS